MEILAAGKIFPRKAKPQQRKRVHKEHCRLSHSGQVKAGIFYSIVTKTWDKAGIIDFRGGAGGCFSGPALLFLQKSGIILKIVEE